MSSQPISDRYRIVRSTATRAASLVLLGTCIVAAAWAQNPPGATAELPRAAPGTADGPAPGGERLREGTLLTDELGNFKLSGDRLTFFCETGERRFGGLENLALERVAKIVADSPETLQWSVSGAVMEYQGTNYLLVSRAMLKSRPARRLGNVR